MLLSEYYKILEFDERADTLANLRGIYLQTLTIPCVTRSPLRDIQTTKA
jgi:hypothetical protein